MEIRTTMQSCVFVGQGNCFFPVNDEKMDKGKEEEEEEEIHNYNAVFRGNEMALPIVNTIVSFH